MKAVKIAELKAQLSKYLRAVERGARIVVTDRSRAIAEIVPVAPERSTLTVIEPRTPLTEIRDRRYRRATWSKASLELLHEERRER